MKKSLAILTVLVITFSSVNAQNTRYVVKLKDKNGTPFTLANPIAYLSQRAIDRRTRYGIAIDSTDLPVTPAYLTQIKNVSNVTVLNVSKWLNSISIQTSDAAAITTITGFSFVQSVTGVGARMGGDQSGHPVKSKLETETTSVQNGTSRTDGTDGILSNYYNYGTNALNEMHLLNAEFLHNIGLRGQGMRIAMLDAGFTNYASLGAFDSVNLNGQMLGTWDFVQGNADVNDHTHGMQTYSCIAANLPGQFVGTSPKASFYLFRTEDAPTEYKIELHNWACGAERADSSGADVISTSLGYSIQFSDGVDIPYSDMNGNTTMAAIAADLAAKKGMLVFASIGNDGTDPNYHFLSTPSDGDSVIAVGAVNAAGAVGNFSSYGPSSDGQVKPDVAAVGVSAVVLNTNNTPGLNNGTSFSCPKMAGISTCLWQGFPEFNNMKIRSALWQSGSISSAPDTRIGYGIPDMKKAFGILVTDFSTANGSITNCKTTLNWTSKDVSIMKYEILRKAPGEAGYTKVLDVPALTGVSVLAISNYTKTDTLLNVQSGTVSYIVRQVIDTAVASLTNVNIDTVNINLASSCNLTTGIPPVNPNEQKISIIPNPASSQFTLKVNMSNPIPGLGIFILDMKGSTVMQFQRSKASGVQQFTLPVSRLAKGKYIVSVYDGKHLLASKELIKL